MSTRLGRELRPRRLRQAVLLACGLFPLLTLAASPDRVQVASRTDGARHYSPLEAQVPDPDVLRLRSAHAIVVDQNTREILFAKDADSPTPIASITKLMTAMVTLDAELDLDERISITDEDVDTLKGTSSRLHIGDSYSRRELLNLALMASENRAASALGRSYPGGVAAFAEAMNRKARAIGMRNSHFVEPTGLSSDNQSTARDLARMVSVAHGYPLIRELSTRADGEFAAAETEDARGFRNTNSLVRAGQWDIGLSKTGFIREAGFCLVMQADIGGRPVLMAMLGAQEKMSRIGDANRIRAWLEGRSPAAVDDMAPAPRLAKPGRTGKAVKVSAQGKSKNTKNSKAAPVGLKPIKGASMRIAPRITVTLRPTKS